MCKSNQKTDCPICKKSFINSAICSKHMNKEREVQKCLDFLNQS